MKMPFGKLRASWEQIKYCLFLLKVSPNTSSIICIFLFTAGFQSTLPRRERPELKGYLKAIDVSIHAPAQGATKPLSLMDERIMFQSTLPRRERH